MLRDYGYYYKNTRSHVDRSMWARWPLHIYIGNSHITLAEALLVAEEDGVLRSRK
jgi:hypothetical protein